MSLMEITGSINVVGYGVITIGTALGVAWIWVSVINGVARQPEAKSALMSVAYIGFAVVEALALLGFLLAFLLR